MSQKSETVASCIRIYVPRVVVATYMRPSRKNGPGPYRLDGGTSLVTSRRGLVRGPPCHFPSSAAEYRLYERGTA